MEFNLADLWERVVDTVPEREALVDGDLHLTYAQADDRIDRLAHFLAGAGIGPGDHVALYLQNGVEYLEGMLAAFKIRAVPINVNYRYVEEELRYLFDDADAKAVLFHREFAPKLLAIRDRVPGLRTFVAVDDGTETDVAALGAARYQDVIEQTPGGRDFPPRSADDQYILYTGGTTGMPKGVMWRHEDIFFGAFGGGDFAGRAISTPEQIAEKATAGRTRCLPACPFMHGTAHWMAFTTLYSGGTVVISPDRRLDPIRLWELVSREHVNFLVIVGDAFARPLVDALDELDGRVDLSELVVILSGGAILSPTIKTALAERLPGSMIIDGYGSSEAGGQGQSVTVAGAPPSDAPRFRVNDETTVLTADFEPAPVGVVGKLARRGHIPVGYYKDPEKTAVTFPVADGVRWSIPGDDARIEEDGTITLLGRGSVSINTGGEKVYPEEVESALKADDDIMDALVVGVPDPRWGERVVALVEPRAGHPVDPAEVDRRVRSHIAGYKAPRHVLVVDAIVRSPSGKPDYRWGKATAISMLAEQPA
ncbi:MAG TPA: acyl-CoA synthetase [Acidimicrobiia bacterium]|jgi:acyl-CoA synthetase (AMP-forming)/AMP-acid ligase II